MSALKTINAAMHFLGARGFNETANDLMQAQADVRELIAAAQEVFNLPDPMDRNTRLGVALARIRGDGQ